MLVWLLAVGEPIPMGARAKDRLHRMGYLAHLLADLGHEVTWWTSSFDHFSKQHLVEGDRALKLAQGLTIQFLHGCGYKSNISLSRIRDHRAVAARFRRHSRQCSIRPDIILAALPPIELCVEAARYGTDRGVPVVVDMRDMWPDIMASPAPRPLQPLARLLLSRMFRDARAACAEATAVTGITDTLVDWGLTRGQRTRSRLDRAFPMGYASATPPDDEIRVAECKWDARGVVADGCFTACFVGSMGWTRHVETVIEGARIVHRSGRAMRFVLCGDGERLPLLRRLAAGLPNVVLPGWANAAEIYVLLRRSSVGLDPLPDRYDFTSTINNKAIEYMSAGLPVILSPQHGVLHDLVHRAGCGMSYCHKDPRGLSELLIRLQGDRATLAQMSANSRRLFELSFTAERVYRNMADYLLEVQHEYENTVRGGATLTSGGQCS